MMSKPANASPLLSREEGYASSSSSISKRAGINQRGHCLKLIRQRCVGAVLAITVLLGGVARAELTSMSPNTGIVTTDRIAIIVEEASRRFAIPPSWIRAVMRAESHGNARALSPKGAMGLMQLMPTTWSDLRIRYGLGSDPYDPHDNITAGAAYLREMHDRYGDRGFLAAYNAGPGRYEVHLATGQPLPSETLSYVAAVTSLIDGRPSDSGNGVAESAPNWTSASLFIANEAVDFMLPQRSAHPRLEDGIAAGVGQEPSAFVPLSDGLFINALRRTGRP
jgi:hypothetical protein